METFEYLTLVAIGVSMVLSALGLFFGIMLRAKDPYRTGWTDVPIEQQLQDSEFRWPKSIRFMGKLSDFWRWMFVGLLITIALTLIGIWRLKKWKNMTGLVRCAGKYIVNDDYYSSVPNADYYSAVHEPGILYSSEESDIL